MDAVPGELISRLRKREEGSERYNVERKIAQGGMGSIYEVFDQDLKRTSVLKVVSSRAMGNALLFRRFIEEARITAQLEHPNIIPVHELGVMGKNRLFFSMKYVRGEPFGSILRKLRDKKNEYVERYSRYALLTIFRKVCDAVAYAHFHGIIHRDIKPDNIMVGGYGEVLLLDWGLARPQEGEHNEDIILEDEQQCFSQHGDSSVERLKTRFGVVKGTPTYMSPEQAKGLVEEIDYRSDIFLLGATLYASVTLQVPFTGNDIYDILANAESGNFVRPAERAPERQIPQELCRIIEKSMAYNKDDRYQSVEELAKDLDALMAGQATPVHKYFRPGEYLMREGTPGYETYVIVKGKVEVTKTIGSKRVSFMTLGKDDVIGEMALILQEPRTANIQAVEDTEVIVLTEEIFKKVLDQVPPWMEKVIDSLANRLQHANVNIHPLMKSDCTYHILNQIRLLYPFWKKEVPDTKKEGNNIFVVPMNAMIREISANLHISTGRVIPIMTILFQSGLLKLRNRNGIDIPDFSFFCQFVEFAKKQIGISQGFNDLKYAEEETKRIFSDLHSYEGLHKEINSKRFPVIFRQLREVGTPKIGVNLFVHHATL